jgi:thiosulfate dehydrogenase
VNADSRALQDVKRNNGNEKDLTMAKYINLAAPSLIAACALGLACIAPLGAVAAEPAATAEVSSIQQAVRQGAEIFANDRFGGAATCETCHVNGGRTAGKLPNGKEVPVLTGAAAAFPGFVSRRQTVVTLSQQIARCIAGGVQGTPPAFGSPAMVDLETYITSLSKGAVMGQQFN